MSENTSYDTFSYLEFISYIRSVLLYYESENNDKYTDIEKDIKILEDRINDENLYLGVVGSFSSGKSTFINSVIRKNLLPTDAVQGTTVAASILKRADYNDLEITYLDGTTKRFSQCAEELVNKYQVDSTSKELTVVDRKSIFIRFFDWLKRLFSIFIRKKTSVYQEKSRIELFKKIIATEEMANDIQYVTLYYQNDNIPYKIAMVDTPGTESLNQRHNEVTKNAIDNICDAIVVVIPYDKPVSEELLNYVNINLEMQKSECIFVVTKIELLSDRDELPRLIRVIKKRLENGLSIESACVIPMPTFIYLKTVDLEMQTNFLDNIPELERSELIQMYEQGIQSINEILNAKRSEFIKKKITSISERISTKLTSNLSDMVVDFEERNRQLQNEMVEPIRAFEVEANREIGKFADILQQRIEGEIGFISISFSQLRSEIENVIDGCYNSQDILSRLDCNLISIFDDILQTVGNQLNETKDGFNSKIFDLQKKFQKKYERCGARCLISSIEVDVTKFFSEDFINECESLLQNRINSIKHTIKGDISGLLKKVKALFSNPTNKHKEFATSEISEIIDDLSQKVKSYSINEIAFMIERMGIDSQRKIESMISYDKQTIEAYINRTNQSLESNNKMKEATLECVKKLNEYIKLMQEVG